MNIVGAWREYLEFIKGLWIWHGSTKEFVEEFGRRSNEIRDILCAEKNRTPMQLGLLDYGEPMGPKATAKAEELVSWVAENYQFQKR